MDWYPPRSYHLRLGFYIMRSSHLIDDVPLDTWLSSEDVVFIDTHDLYIVPKTVIPVGKDNLRTCSYWYHQDRFPGSLSFQPERVIYELVLTDIIRVDTHDMFVDTSTKILKSCQVHLLCVVSPKISSLLR
jgi:hypothetical protein